MHLASSNGMKFRLFRKALPYCLHRMQHDKFRHVYLPLNRDYKPLGVLSNDHVRYQDYIDSHAIAFYRDPSAFKVWYYADEVQAYLARTNNLYLYSDLEQSLSDYFVRLKRLMMHKHIYVGLIESEVTRYYGFNPPPEHTTPPPLNAASHPHQ